MSQPAWEPPPEFEQYQPVREHRPFRDLLKRIWAPIAAIGATLLKWGAILFTHWPNRQPSLHEMCARAIICRVTH